jgi:hypothetical protein
VLPAAEEGSPFMLPDRQRQLLTAFVDGELSSRQRRCVARLLGRSEEARQLLQKLRADAEALQRYPAPHFPVDLMDEILHKIKDRGLAPGKGPLVKRTKVAFWSGPFGAWAAAAAVLLSLGLASYLYFASSLAHSDRQEVAEKTPPTGPQDGTSDEPRTVAVAKTTAPSTTNQPKATTKSEGPPRIRPMMKVRPNVAAKTMTQEKTLDPPKEEGVLTDRMEMFQYSKVETVLPVVLKVRELEQESVRNKLLAELRKDVNHHLELPCPNRTKAFERVQAVAKALNIGLLIEKRAQERLKQPALKTNYVIYIENITHEELARFVQQIGVEDKKGNGQPAENPIDRLVLTRITPQHHKELSTLLGVDPTESAPKGPLEADPHKPLSDLTAEQVGKALAGQGGTPRSEAGKPPQIYSLVLPFNPVRPYPGSPEIKRFLESRKPTKPGTIRVLLVLRG